MAALEGGWVEPIYYAQAMPANPERGRPDKGYVDIVVHDGYNQIALFSPVSSRSPVMLTSGAWEVVESAFGVDLENNMLYFVAARESPSQRHLYAVRLDGSGLRSVTDIFRQAFYNLDMDHGTHYAVLNYKGPELPRQSLARLQNGSVECQWELGVGNGKLETNLKNRRLPRRTHQTIYTAGGYQLSIMELLPADFDPKLQYPTIFHIYGGPGSQKVNMKFEVDF
ncbi:Putative dipeptidylpeptidase IV domain, alpha/Beta hydrolase [Colletotrichum destructivum]|uniref:Probable dipeptidyl-aminopeptidase B n=1 Tax=Colletotrichum destructivum TaxID=34406 RepID=A0AAX4J3R7_9PEZI|nr:Putative dipeptidylpeptidase IV domain, alpha/Beta hydrolase [Colletotrichum destructivum]